MDREESKKILLEIGLSRRKSEELAGSLEVSLKKREQAVRVKSVSEVKSVFTNYGEEEEGNDD